MAFIKVSARRVAGELPASSSSRFDVLTTNAGVFVIECRKLFGDRVEAIDREGVVVSRVQSASLAWCWGVAATEIVRAGRSGQAHARAQNWTAGL